MKRPIAARTAIHLVLVLGAVCMVGPFLWMVLTSLKTMGQSTQVPPILVPWPLKWSNYADAVGTLPFVQFYLNTTIATMAKTAGQILLCSLAGYSFARLRYPGRDVLFILTLSLLMVPGQVYLLPQYMIMKWAGWLNSVTALIVPGLFSAFGTFLLRQFFLTLPRDVEEAARIDGANPLQIYWHIALPLARSAMVALGIYVAVWSWNDFMWPMIVNDSPAKMTLSAGLASLQGQYGTNYPILMAGAVLAVWPMLLLFGFLQKQFIEGIALTGSKG